jgi:hypothetical protein
MLDIKIDLTVFQNYILEISTDGEDWVEFANYYDISGGTHVTDGSNTKTWSVEPFDYGCDESGVCYIRLRNCDPTKGWGGSIKNLTLHYKKEA